MMALWTTEAEDNRDLYTTIYFLRDALFSALDDAAFLKNTACRKPDTLRGSGHAEIAARLTRFRMSFNALKSREAMMITKIIRAREWAVSLRRAAPHIREDIEQFLDATAVCQTIQSDFVANAQRAFHGADAPARFLEQRQGDAGDRYGAGLSDYRVGGRVDLLELRLACEVFLSQIEQTFIADHDADEPEDSEPSWRYLQLTDEMALPAQNGGGSAFQ